MLFARYTPSPSLQIQVFDPSPDPDLRLERLRDLSPRALKRLLRLEPGRFDDTESGRDLADRREPK